MTINTALIDADVISMKPLTLIIFNFLLFQGLWFLAVTQGNSPLLWFFVPAVLLHFLYLARVYGERFSWRNELLLIVFTVVLGFGVELLAMALNVWDAAPQPFLPPLFLMLLWVGFAMTLHISFDFLRHKIALTAILGGFFAPISYAAGAHLNTALEFSDAMLSPLIVALLWMLVFPLLMLMAQRLPLLKTQANLPTE